MKCTPPDPYSAAGKPDPQNAIERNMGAALVKVNGVDVWVYAGSQLLSTPDGILVHPPQKWRPNSPRFSVEYFSDGRPPRAHDFGQRFTT